MKVSVQDVRNDYQGFAQLIELAHQLAEVLFEKVNLDMSRVSWFEANMCAPWGAILYKIGRNKNTISLEHLSVGVEKILSKNEFLSNYGHPLEHDTYGTTIRYCRFNPEDDRFFGKYIDGQLVGKGIPRMTTGLKKKFQESIFEIFSNAVIHSQTKMGIYSCGQFFPKKHRLDFSIADLGLGMRKVLQERGGLNYSAEEAINWAMSENNTTKTGSVPGGLGLKLLREFITLNEGRIQIVSDQGYWELNQGKVAMKKFEHPFPGTVVTMEINTADTKSYCLTSEISPERIF